MSDEKLVKALQMLQDHKLALQKVLAVAAGSLLGLEMVVQMGGTISTASKESFVEIKDYADKALKGEK